MPKGTSQQAWDRWQENMHWVIKRIMLKGGEVQEPEILPPIPASQVEEFESLTSLSLPKDFVDMVVHFSGGFRFAWSLYNVYERYRDVSIKRGGNWEVPFVGASKTASLLDLYHKLQSLCGWILNPTFDDDKDIQESRRVIPHCFPLYLDCGGGGDYMVLRIDTDPAQVLYLDHEWGYSVRGRAVLGRGFADYVTRWSSLGYPEIHQYSNFYHEEIGTLDVASKTAQFWLEWLNSDR